MKENICIFSAQYLPHMGGVERYTYYIAKELVARGHRVTVVTSCVNGLAEFEETEGIRIYREPSFDFMNGRMPVLRPGRNVKEMEKKLIAEKFDFVLINTRFYLLSLYAARFAKKNGMACAVVEHGTGHLTFNNKVLDVFEHIYEHGITAILKHYCKDYYGVSKACCEWSAHFGISSKGVLYNSIDIEEMEKLLANPVKSYRKDFHVDDSAIVITFTGRMIIEKGIYELIDAMKKLKTSKKVVVFMAGDGPELEKVNKTAHKLSNSERRIIPLGRIDFAHISALLGESDIYCLPSVSEGFPTSVLEAVAAKCYVITTYKGGAKELIQNGVSGTIIPNNNVDYIVEALEKVIADNELRTSAANKAYETLYKEFTWKNTVDKLVSITGSGKDGNHHE